MSLKKYIIKKISFSRIRLRLLFYLFFVQISRLYIWVEESQMTIHLILNGKPPLACRRHNAVVVHSPRDFKPHQKRFCLPDFVNFLKFGNFFLVRLENRPKQRHGCDVMVMCLVGFCRQSSLSFHTAVESFLFKTCFSLSFVWHKKCWIYFCTMSHILNTICVSEYLICNVDRCEVGTNSVRAF